MTEPIEILQQIIDLLVHLSEKELLSQYLTTSATFFKTQYKEHVLPLTTIVLHMIWHLYLEDSQNLITQSKHIKRLMVYHVYNANFHTACVIK